MDTMPGNENVRPEKKASINSLVRVLAKLASRISLLILFFGIGIISAAAIHALIFDVDVTQHLYSLQAKNTFCREVFVYRKHVALALVCLFAALLITGVPFLKKLLSSWVNRTFSGLALYSFLTALLVFFSGYDPIRFRLLISLTIMTSGCFFSYVVRGGIGKYRIRSARPEKAERFPGVERRLRAFDSDEPILTWEEDLLDRWRIVDLLAMKVIDLKRPVVVLNGRFGSGKSSVLNLLRLRLDKEAVVVSFSAWLPGSESTLTDFLVSDIVAECRKHFVIPGLATNARRFAAALSKSVPYLSGASEILPPLTQRDALNDLRTSLGRVPMRVVVLVDEVDRMQKPEILELLKLLRGVVSMDNLSFVCTCDREHVIDTIKPSDDPTGDQTRVYFEKFFLDVLPLSEPSPETLQEIGIGRMQRTLESCQVLKTESEKSAFNGELRRLWPDCFTAYCCNLRKVGILANDFQGAATLLGRDVNPVDLALVMLLYRIDPEVHKVVATQQPILTGGFKGANRQRYMGDKERSKREAQLVEQIDALSSSEDEKELIRAILKELFPLFSGFIGKVRTSEQKDDLGKSLKVSHPWMFDAYFRLETPRDVFSGSELEQFLDAIRNATSLEDVKHIFGSVLDEIEKGSDRSEDFLWKVSLCLPTLNENLARWLALSSVHFANRYYYDRDVRLWRDSLYAFRAVREMIIRLGDFDKAPFFCECIEKATDDTMVFGLIARLTDLQERRDEENPNLPLKAVWEAFTSRMRRRYGADVDVASEEVIRASDADAFWLWGKTALSKWNITAKASDREMRDDFWLRYIGFNKRRLANIFKGFFLPIGAYQIDAEEFVAERISLSVLRQLNDNVLWDAELTPEEAASLQRLRKLLNGDYKEGIPMADWRS